MKILAIMIMMLNSLIASATTQIMIPKASGEGLVARTYDGKWKMITKVDGKWVFNGTISENLAMDDNDIWHHVQLTEYLDKNIAPTKVSRILRKNDHFTEQLVLDIINNSIVSQENSHYLKKMTLDFRDKAATQRAVLMDDSKHKREIENLPFNGFDGFILGLVLSGFELRDGSVFRLPVIMFRQIFTPYWVDAYVHKTESVKINGKSKKLWRVDTRWLDVSSGTTNPAGPEETGGSYYILQNPEQNQAAVYRYKNASVDIILNTGEGHDK